ncbi:uncharacterized protein TRAVEDRAFT_64530 [Trametes versicolor FP-101664 SS1]|uniref:uncharacterized protein n=1 Tax=Trametes versicolor (strain FP-101664) TaxID=717944 RepID=UPI00046240CF|nr:uncharacterized protein TRAVEDRAFT_64530 [Trametes versicolor FP-101664 SS1]EIW59538.1 hypothetical protein TRAVEDRAFT_64530 [Trametes versicolor FP-101664 SS1]
MTSIAHRPAPCDALRGIVDDISQQRFSMRLPPEILGHIFSLVPSSLPTHGFMAPSSARHTYDLPPLTQVCRRWRAIALDASSLWSTICESSPTHTATDGTHASAVLSNVLAHDADDIAELRLCGLQNVPTARLASEFLASPAPKLKHAAIRCRARYSGSEAPAVLTPVAELWSGMAPKLETLELHDVPFIPSNSFQSLTVLTLFWETTSVEWALSDLLALLEGAPLLERISLRGLPSDLHLRNSHPPDTPASIALPRLQTLEIGDCRGPVCSVPLLRLILTHLAVPVGASIRLYGLDARRLLDQLDFAPAIFHADDMRTRLTIDMSFTMLTLSLSDLGSTSSFCVELGTGGATKAALAQAVTAFAQGSVAPSVRELVVRSQRAWASWCEPALLLALFPRVGILELQDTHLASSVVDALRPSMVEGAVGDVLCPELATIHFPSLGPELVQQLNFVSRDRASCGAPALHIPAGHQEPQALVDVVGDL